jgi:membrane protease YdiL (CAAX protease family)
LIVTDTHKQRGIAAFLLIAFGLAWILWEIPLRLGVSPGSPLFQAAILPGAFAPAIACLAVRRWITREGFADAGLRLNLRRWRCYLAGWLLPLPVVAVIVLLAAALGIARPDFTLTRALEALAPGLGAAAQAPAGLVALLPFQLLLTALIATPLLWGEEFGWRSYLQIRLFAERPLLAAAATGLIWGAWHYPLNLRGYNYPGQPILGLVLFPVGTLLLSIIFGWLRLRTGSIWAPSLAHAATNAVGGSLTLLLFLDSGADPVWYSYLGVLGWLPLGVVCAIIVFTGGLRPEPESESQGE